MRFDSAGSDTTLISCRRYKPVLLQRVITAIVLVAGLILLTTFASPFYFALITAAIVLVAGYEWTNFVVMTRLKSKVGYLASLVILIAGLFPLIGISTGLNSLDQGRVTTVLVLALIFWFVAVQLMRGYPQNSTSWSDQSRIALMGIFVLIPAWLGLTQLKFLDPTGIFVLALVAMVSVADIGAYFTGKTWGHRQLAANLSPKKSWEGFWGGLGACTIFTLSMIIVLSFTGYSLSAVQSGLLLIGSVAVFISSVFGDLFESMLKRNRGIKDSGTILPGHGGIMDRIDSLTAATPVYVLIVFLVF
jgi:phosphatidate cytidylyltransferase